MINSLLKPSIGNRIARLPKVFIAFAFLIFFGNAAKAQVGSNYICTQNAISPAYSDLTTKTVVIGATWNDDAPVSVPTGFATPFNFNGFTYANVNISPNGYIYFGTASAGINTEYFPISSTNTYAGAIAGYGANLKVTTTSPGTPQPNSVSYFLDTSGGAGNYIFKVEYRLFRKSATESGGYMSMQIWLYETTNVIEIRYGVQSGTFNTNTTGQIGLRGLSNTDVNNLKWTSTVWPAGTMTNGTTAADNANSVRTANLGTVVATGSYRLFRWTPVTCFAPAGITVNPIVANGGTINWTAPTPAPANGYQYEVRTSGAPGSGPAGLAASGTTAAGIVTAGVSTLTGNTTYTVYVRSDCGGSFSAWSTGVAFTTLCTAANIPYTGMYFDELDTDGYTYPALPSCTSIQNVGTGNNWVTDNTNEEGFGDGGTDGHLMYNASGSQAANVWFFTKGINLVGGNTYRLSYTYGGSTNFSFITNKMEVAYGSSPTAAGMATSLVDHTNIKASPVVNVINFTAPSTGVFYFGFRAHSVANQGRIFLDDIEVVPSICIKPAGVTVTSFSYNSATISWTAPSPVPGSGYAYYVSTSPTPPTSLTTPSGFTAAGTTVVNLTGLSGSTTYYFWVRGNCGSPDDSEWSGVQTFTTTATPPYCIPGASASSSTYVSNVTITNAITNINNSSLYTSPGYADYTSQLVTESQGGSFNFSVAFSDAGLGVHVYIYIDWNGDGDFNDALETAYDSGGFLFTSPAPAIPPGVITVPAGATLGTTRMRVVADYWNGGTSCALSTTGPRGEMEDYSFKVVVPPPAITISSASSTQCAGITSPLVTITSPLANFDTYSWSPSSGVSGDAASGYTFTAGSTLTYTLTGTQTSAPFSTNTVTFTYNANPLPTPITITPTPSTSTTCQSGPAIQLTASGGVVSGVPVITENFNSGAAPGWTTTNTSSGSPTPASSSWTVHPDAYVPTGPSWFGTILHSNDNTGIIFSDSDSNQLGSHTIVDLISPVFSLSGYTAASLSFWQYYKEWSPSTASVQISVNGTAGPWTTLQSYTTTTQGTPTAWSHVVLDLSAYVGQANLAIRYDYDANWGWGWGIDNFLVSGSATSAITWTPIAGLYSDAAATIPYVANTGAITVYALPSSSTTYTASASTPMPTVCTTSTTASVTINPIVAGTASSNQTVCDGLASNLTLAGTTGTITGWQYATNLAFTAGVTNIPSSASATLTTTQMGTLTATRYFRAVVTNGGCTAYSNVITVTVSNTTWNGLGWSNGTPSATKGAIFAGNYTSSGNLTACSVRVNSGTVTFLSGHSLIVQNAVDVVGGSLVFNNNASLVQVNDVSVNSNTASFIYKRDSFPMRIYDYTYWSSPVFPESLFNLSPLTMADKYFRYDAPTSQWIQTSSVTIMTPGVGYIIRSPQTFTATPQVYNAVYGGTGTNNGVPNNGIITVPIAGPGPNNFNLIGNPYPSAVDADLFLQDPANATLLDGTIYFWTHNTPIDPYNYTQSDYAMYNAVGGVGTPASGTGNTSTPLGNIAAGQAFFAKGLTNGNATFKNSMRLTGLNNQFYRMSPAQTTFEKSRLWLDIRNNANGFKQMLLGYVETATNDRDRNFDGDAATATSLNLYSVLGPDKLCIQGRALPFDVNDLVPIGYSTTQAGTFEISLSNYDGLFADQDVYLEDTVLNVIHNLKSGSYSFSTAAGTFDTRFILRYTDGTSLGVDNPIFNEQSVVVYKDDSGIHINTSNITMDSVKVFDIRGSLILDKKGINSNETVISNLAVAQQVLIIQITSDDNRVVNKKIVY